MNQLMPIIRRKRRPLLPVVEPARADARPTEVENVQHPRSNTELPEMESQSRLTSAATKKIKHDAKVTHTR